MRPRALMGALGALALTGAAYAQEDSSATEQSQSAQSSAPREQTQPARTPGTTATSPTEGTAADTTPPGGTPGNSDPQSASTPQQSASRDTRLAAADTTDGARRGSMLTGEGVYSKQGALLGAVKDLVIDPQSGRVTHAIVATGGSVTGGSQNLAAIPWDALKSGMHQGRIVMDEQRLQDAPSFGATQWPNLQSDGWSQDADRYWKNASGASAQ